MFSGRHDYASWTLRAADGRYLSVDTHNQLLLDETPTIFKVYFVGRFRELIKLFVPGKGFVRVKAKLK